MDPNKPDSDSIRRSHEAYLEYNRTLRAWYAAFGVGGPALLVTNEKLLLAVEKSGLGSLLVICFFGGLTLQVLNALANKWMNWYRYEDICGRAARPKFMKGVALWYRDAYLLHVVFDIVTGLLYLATIVSIIKIVVK